MAQFFEFTADGIRFKGFQDIRSELKQAWETTFGVQLDNSPTSPDGHHIDLETKTINSVLEAVQVVTTMLNRNQAKGVFLDYLASLLGLARNDNETDDELRARMDGADTSGVATYDGMLTYLRDQIHSSVNLLQNEEPEMDDDGIPGHQFRVVVPQAVYDALVEKEEAGEIESADNYIAQKIWNCKAAGIKADGNKTGKAKDVANLEHDVKFSLPQNVEIEISVTLTLYDEESFPTGGEQAVADAIRGWATGTDGWAKAEYIPGKDVIPMRLSTPILTVPGIESAEIKVRKAGTSVWSGDKIAISSQETAVVANVYVEVGS